MFQHESPSYPHTLAQWFYIVVAWFLGNGVAAAILTLWQKRKHGPAEVRKLDAEARSIEIRDDIAIGDFVLKLTKDVAVAAIEAERLRDERNHWELKAFDLQVELKESRAENAQLMTQASLDNYQIRRQMAFIEMENLKEKYLATDRPKE